MSQQSNRTKYYATIVYPESAPDNWIQKIKDMHIQCLISPLHDKDVNPDGTIKKPHYHVLFIFDAVKNFETQVKPIFNSINGVGKENIASIRGYARYLCHLDNPEKAQYNVNNIQALNGANYFDITALQTDIDSMLCDIFDFIDINDIISFAAFIRYSKSERKDWFRLVTTSRAYIIDKYIKSRTYEKQMLLSSAKTTNEEDLDTIFSLINKKIKNPEVQMQVEAVLRKLL